jgi:hypothetical protein
MIQSEIEDLEGTLQQSQNNDTSLLRDLLDKIPDGIFGGNDKKAQLEDIQNNAQAAQMENVSVSPREPEEFTEYVRNIFRQIMPAIEFHDQLLKDISEAISKIPILPKIIEQLEEQLSIFVFQVIAPFVVPVIEQIKNELATGATEIIASSKNEQHNVFQDDNCTDPTHSMLSKDHFTNVRLDKSTYHLDNLKLTPPPPDPQRNRRPHRFQGRLLGRPAAHGGLGRRGRRREPDAQQDHLRRAAPPGAAQHGPGRRARGAGFDL